MAMGADYSFELISIETHAPQFIGHNKFFLARVYRGRQFQIAGTIVKEDLQALCKVFPVLVNLGHFQRFKLRVIR